MSVKVRPIYSCSLSFRNSFVKRLLFIIACLILLRALILEYHRLQHHSNRIEPNKIYVQNKSLGVTIQVTAPKDLETLRAFTLHYQKCPCVYAIKVLTKSDKLSYDLKGAFISMKGMQNMPSIEIYKYKQHPTDFFTDGKKFCFLKTYVEKKSFQICFTTKSRNYVTRFRCICQL